MMQEEEKFKLLLSRVSELFLKYGLRSISMDDISHELGISKKTLYNYVSNKAELIEAVMDNNRDLICTSMTGIQNQGYNAIEELLEISNVVYSYHDSFNQSMTFDLEKYYPDLFLKFREGKLKAVHAYVTDNLNKGIAEGLYRNDLDVSLVASLYVKKMEDVRDERLFQGEGVTFERVFEVMFENHIRGISNESGIAYFEKIKEKYQLKRSK